MSLVSIWGLWACLGVLLTVGVAARRLHMPYDQEPHAFAKAHLAVMARNFSEQGIVALRGIPIQNNPPFGRSVEAYITWPPLHPMLLGVAFRHFGASDTTARIVALLFSLACMGALFGLISSVLDRETALATVFVAQMLPVFVIYNDVWTVNSGLTAALLAWLALHKGVEREKIRWGWIAAGCAAVIISVGLSWEGLLVSPAALAVGLFQRNRRVVAAAMAYGAVAFTTALMMLAVYLSSFPQLYALLVQEVSFRLGLGFNQSRIMPTLHTLGIRTVMTDTFTLKLAVITTGSRLFSLIGEIALIAMGSSAFWIARMRKKDRNGKIPGLLIALAIPWGLWFGLFNQHVTVHEYQMLLGVPVAALSVGIALVGGTRWRGLAGAPWAGASRWILLGVVPAVLFGSGIRSAYGTLHPEHTAMVDYALAVRQNTPPGSVVLSPSTLMQVTYYADRHLVKGIVDDATLDQAIELLPGEFPQQKIYLALSPDTAGHFSRALATYPIRRRDQFLILLELPSQ